MKPVAVDAGLRGLGRVTGVHSNPRATRAVRGNGAPLRTSARDGGADERRRARRCPSPHPRRLPVAFAERAPHADHARRSWLRAFPFEGPRGRRAACRARGGSVHRAAPRAAALQRASAEASLPLSSGLLGYFAYDLKDCLEELPRTSVDDLGLPLLHLVAPSVIVIHDRISEATTLLAMRLQGDDAASREDVARFKEALGAPPRERAPQSTGKCTSVFSRAEYLSAVEAVRSYIVEGDVYQVNMSQRFQGPFAGDPFDCFAKMYAVNPALLRVRQRRRSSDRIDLSRALHRAPERQRRDPPHQGHPASREDSSRG